MTAIRRHPLILLFMFVFFVGVLFWARLAGAATPDPIEHPVEFWDALSALRTSGGLYLMIAVAVAAIAKSVARVLKPADGSAATGLRGRAISTLAAVALIAGALVDLLLGSLTGGGLAVAAAGAAAMMQDPRDRPSARSGAVTATFGAALVFMLASCGQLQLRDRAANGVRVGLDCTTPALRADARDGYDLARVAIESAIRDDGTPDLVALRSAGGAMRRDGLRCAFAAAIVALSTPPRRDPAAPQSLGLEVDGKALRAAGREIAAVDWGVRGSILLPGGGSLDPHDDPDAGGQ